MGQDINVPDINLYHEIRERLAIAAETQILIFLSDIELHNITMSLYESIYHSRVMGQLQELNFLIEPLNEGNLFITLHSKKNILDIIKLERKIIDDVFKLYDQLIQERLQKNLDADITAKAYIENNKIIIELL